MPTVPVYPNACNPEIVFRNFNLTTIVNRGRAIDNP